MVIRVSHLVNPTFGAAFSGHTHYLFSLLSGWKGANILLDLYGTRVKPVNLNSGDRAYRLPQGSLWSYSKKLSRWGRVRWSYRLLEMLIRRRREYDVVHFHTLGWGVLVSPLILHPLGKKIVFTMSLFGNDNPGYIYNRPRGKLQVALMRRFDGIVCLSTALADDSVKYGLRNVITLPNFLAVPQLEEEIDPGELQANRLGTRTILGIPAKAQVLLFVGSIIRRKGVDVLVDMFIALAGKYPRLHLVLVGPQSKDEAISIDEAFVDRLKEKIEGAGLRDRVHWAGLIREQSELIGYYRAADIFVFPTRNEGSPNVFAEAMAAGLPVVASRLPGITDVAVADGQTGWLVEPDSVSAFVQAVDRLLQDEPWRISMGKAGREMALEKFGFAAYCQKLAKFYSDLMASKENQYE